MLIFKNQAILALGILLGITTGPTTSSAVTCPASPGVTPGSQIFTVAVGASSCLGSGEGAINQPADTPAILSSYLFLDKSGSSDGFEVLDGSLTITNGVSSGNWSINAPGYENFALLLFQSASPRNPDWGAFALNALSGTWLIQALNPQSELVNVNLSHAILYGQACDGPCDRDNAPDPTPIPGAAFLMGTVLAGGAGFGAWRRKRKQAA